MAKYEILRGANTSVLDCTYIRNSSRAPIFWSRLLDMLHNTRTKLVITMSVDITAHAGVRMKLSNVFSPPYFLPALSYMRYHFSVFLPLCRA